MSKSIVAAGKPEGFVALNAENSELFDAVRDFSAVQGKADKAAEKAAMTGRVLNDRFESAGFLPEYCAKPNKAERMELVTLNGQEVTKIQVRLALVEAVSFGYLTARQRTLLSKSDSDTPDKDKEERKLASKRLNTQIGNIKASLAKRLEDKEESGGDAQAPTTRSDKIRKKLADLIDFAQKSDELDFDVTSFVAALKKADAISREK